MIIKQAYFYSASGFPSQGIFITSDAVPSNQVKGRILGYKMHYTFRVSNARTTNDVSIAMAYLNLKRLKKD